MGDETPKPAVPGLTDPTAGRVERVPVRTREAGVTLSAWRLEVAAAEGKGAIVRLDGASGPVFRGDGLFLGWPQARLQAAYAALQPPAEDDPGAATQQLG